MKYLVSLWLPLGIFSIIEQHFLPPPNLPFEAPIIFHMLHKKSLLIFGFLSMSTEPEIRQYTAKYCRCLPLQHLVLRHSRYS